MKKKISVGIGLFNSKVKKGLQGCQQWQISDHLNIRNFVASNRVTRQLYYNPIVEDGFI